MSATGGAPVKSTFTSALSTRRYDETPEEGVRVTRYGGVSDIIGAAPSMSIAEVEKNVARQEEVIIIAKKEVDNARQEAEIHKQLELDAVELKKNNLAKALSMSQYVQQLEQEVELAKAREVALEEQRALAHKEAVAKEEERVKAKTAEVLSREEAKEAEKLELRHRSGQLYAMKKAQQHELEVKEAELRIESLKLHAQYPELQGAPLTGEAAKIEVEVTPRDIPERRVFDMKMQSPSTGLAEAQIEEHAPSVISSEKRAEDIAVERHESAEKLKKKRKVKKGHEGQHLVEEQVTAQAQDVSSEALFTEKEEGPALKQLDKDIKPHTIPISSPDVGGEVDTAAKPIPISTAPPEGVEKTKKKSWVSRMINK